MERCFCVQTQPTYVNIALIWTMELRSQVYSTRDELLFKYAPEQMMSPTRGSQLITPEGRYTEAFVDFVQWVLPLGDWLVVIASCKCFQA